MRTTVPPPASAYNYADQKHAATCQSAKHAYRTTNGMPFPMNIHVVGNGHSGTSVMLAMLDSHPDIQAIGPETKVFMDQAASDDAILREINSWRETFSLSQQCRYIAEKTPRHLLRVARIFQILPDAKVINMIRDGRDVALSQHEKEDDFRRLCRRWRTSAQIQREYEQHPQFHTVKYEDLVSSPEETLKDVCDFLGVEYHQRMLQFHETERNWYSNSTTRINQRPIDNASHKRHRNWQINQPLFDGSAKWKHQMTEEQKLIFKQVAGKDLIRLGYETSNDW